MTSATLVIYVTYVTRAAGAAILVWLLWGLYRRYRKGYLRHWTWSWLALCGHYLAAAAAIYLSARYSPGTAPLLLALALAGIAGYLQVGLLLFGVFELTKRRHVRLLTFQLGLPALALLGLLSSFPFLSGTIQSRWLTSAGLYGLAAGTAFLWAALRLWRERELIGGIGFRLLAAAFLIYGVQQLHYFLLTAFSAPRTTSDYLVYLGFVDFIVLMLMAVGMVASLLEDEREAARIAMGEIEHLAYHDALTGLPNRPLFMDRLIVATAHARRTGHKVGVLFIDIDGFNEINDSLGHSAGDHVLKVIGSRIEGIVRSQDTVARFGAGDFALLTQRMDYVEHAARFADSLLELVREPFHIDDMELRVTATIGVSFFPDDGDDAETLIRNADTAVNRAKEIGRNRFQIYAADMNRRAREILALENGLHRALLENELVLHYQPLIDLENRRVFGVEALVRWNHPERGFLMPKDFIRVAEVTGLILPIGEWVLKAACRDIRRLQDAGSSLTVAINLSTRQFQQEGLAERIRHALDDNELDGSSLEIEITESNAMENAEASMKTLAQLKQVGVALSLDDFGTGYSSLDYLKRFPIDTLKLDQTFVRDIADDPGDAAIATAVIAMAHSLGLKVIAEGVETSQQLEILRAKHCDRIQGYLFSEPLSIDNLEEWLCDGRLLALA